MIRRRTRRTSGGVDSKVTSGDIHEWVLSLPWVVEDPPDAASPEVRAFVVDCPPLHRQRFLLATYPPGENACGEIDGTHLAAIMSVEASEAAGEAGWEVHSAVPLAAGHVLLTVEDEGATARDAIETFVLAAYSYAMS